MALGARGPEGSEKRRHLEVFGRRSDGDLSATRCCKANAVPGQCGNDETTHKHNQTRACEQSDHTWHDSFTT